MLKRIRIEDLQVGMIVAGLGCHEPPRSATAQGRTVSDQGVLDSIRQSGEREVWIDPDRGADLAADAGSCGRTEMAVELEHAVALLRRARAGVEQIFISARRYHTLELDRAQALTADIAASVERNPGALISLARLKSRGDYTPLHSIAVCALMLGLARQLGLDPETGLEAGLGGLLHDIGKALVPPELLDKPGRLSPAEFDQIRRHPVLGYALLAEAGKLGPIPLEICLRHHERIDGSGYPQGRGGEALGLYARMSAVCDVYDATTSERPYHDSGQAADAIRMMAAGAGSQFDERVFHAFVKTVGIYPVGSMVRLASQRLAVVVEQGESSLLTPKVRVFYDLRTKRRLSADTLDLAAPGCEDRILARENAGNWRFGRLEELWLEPATVAA